MNKKIFSFVLIIALIVPCFGDVSAQVCPICSSDFNRYVCMEDIWSEPCLEYFYINGIAYMCMIESDGIYCYATTGKECMFGHIYDPSYSSHLCERWSHSCGVMDGICCPY